ncbi:3-deoxy-D-manno-octulosonic acid transferase [Geobacter sp. SVR]|uniref:3-deoxy-D-manno-octulosonic acid transferase n=1 Tax=Geobacter sp. SVR TaxID=2495594 RepID=UPI00143EF89B|nr:3-deoxy-D-manno-octulosonic acid transferase [Geobacter sp. SVR]BCS52425.1 3-deoxy-D-manno-octulosonic acid transferase [Geobacter sp. SVR]GCF87344.1 3-deoxy-D-manno-octulosonic acid transferase [Geobacter sp. SVR]
MFYLIYNILSLFLLFPVCAYHLYRSVSRGRRPAFGERFGLIPAQALLKANGRPVIWLHAVSVGEAIASRPLLKALRARYPGHALVVSTTTETGRTIAEGFPERDLCIYFPFDFLPAVRRTLDIIRPELVIIMETEIWPNFTREACRRGIPVLLANGRISDRSFGRYLRLSWFFRHPLRLFSALCMQTATDRDRIVAIGAPAERTLVAGNLKYDIPFRRIPAKERAELRERYAIPRDLTALCAGSTHPGEEEYVLEAYRALLAEGLPLFLILVPRHPERADAVAALLERNNLPYRRRTALRDSAGYRFHPGEVLLVDTIGELMGLYALSDLVFVGGSLVPTGGHNLLEPASVGVVSIFGPHMTNFREIAALTLDCDAGVQIESPAGLAAACRSLITDRNRQQAMGENGLRMMQENGGATERHLQVIAGYL